MTQAQYKAEFDATEREIRFQMAYKRAQDAVKEMNAAVQGYYASGEPTSFPEWLDRKGDSLPCEP